MMMSTLGANRLGISENARQDALYTDLAPRSLWSIPSKPPPGDTNPVSKCYYELWAIVVGRWFVSLIILALSAFLLSREPPSPLFEVAVAHIVVVRCVNVWFEARLTATRLAFTFCCPVCVSAPVRLLMLAHPRGTQSSWPQPQSCGQPSCQP